MVRRILENHGRKLLRYAGVSCVGITAGQLLLYFFFVVLDLRAVLANTLAVAIATVPSYILNRAWVWGKSGGHSVTSEILPFWGLAFIGLMLSNVFVHFAEQRWESWLVVNGANMLAFGLIWIVKYIVLERALFRDEPAPTEVDGFEALKSAKTPV